MQDKKPTKTYTASKKKTPKKNGSDFFEQFIKSFKFVVNKAMAGSVQHIAILIAGAVLTVAVVGGVVWGVSSLIGGSDTPGGNYQEVEIDPEADNNYDKNAATIDTSKYASTILQETEDAGEDYIKNTLFVGDSNTVRSLLYGMTTWENVVGAVGMGVQNITTEGVVNFMGMNDPVDVVTAIRMIQPQRIIVTYGTNNTGWTSETFIEEYKKALAAIEEAYPYCDIIVNAIPPVHRLRDYPNVTMQQVDAFNAAIAQMCEDEGYKFLNSAEVLKDETTGFAKEEYTISDGLHLSKAGFEALFNYIRTHAYETEDRRPELSYCPKRNETDFTIIGEDPIAIRGRVSITFASNDYELGYVDGEVQQSVKYTMTSDAVTAVAKSENGGIFTGWTCEYGGISDPNAATITYTVPQLSEEITTITITANFKKGDVDISQNALSLTVGQTATLTASASGGHGITWSSSNTNVATVSNGTVKAVGAGTAKITASALDGSMSASCTVTVAAAATPTPEILKEIFITAANDAKEVKVGSTLELAAVAKPEGAQLGTVEWTSSDTSVATVTKNGTKTGVTGVKAGTAKITASVNGGNLTAEYTITVVSTDKPLTGITVSADLTTIEVGKTTTVKATKAPADTTDTAKVEFTSSNTGVATVDSNGVVTGKAEGTAEITAKCGSYSAKITITVQKAHTHSGGTATCKDKAKCTVCGIPYGDLLTTHTWVEATCKVPKTCSVCGKTEGTAKEHTPGAAATCGDPQICTVCGTELAKATGNHTWAEATCTTAKTCSVCNATEGSALGHTAGDAATCTTAQTCTVCGTELESAKGHSWVDATYEAPETCSRCGVTEGEKLTSSSTTESTVNSNQQQEQPQLVLE